MKTKLLFHTVMAFEALLVIIQLSLKQDPWFSMLCFWAIVVMDNLQDVFNEWRLKH